MSSSGALVFVAQGREKVVYNHADSCPDGLGKDTLKWLHDVIAGGVEDEARAQAMKLIAVTESSYPSKDQLKQYPRFAKVCNSNGLDDWYSLLKYTQSDPAAILEAGVYEDVSKFPQNSIHCEWVYVVNFDDRTLEAYKGLRRTEPVQGRWVGRSAEGGYAVDRIRVWSFDDLPILETMDQLWDEFNV